MSSTTAVYVSTSYRADLETRELGEDYPELQKVDRICRLLERRLTRAARLVAARAAIASLTELNLLLADARHDSSFDGLLARAENAVAEAGVLRMRPKPTA